MFGCIFFTEDASLSVVNEKDPKLEKVGNFQPKERVLMKWGKRIYNGTIIKVSDDEEQLSAFATKAYNSVVKGMGDAVSEVPEALFSFNCMPKKSGEKRERKKTIKLQESNEQDKELSPGPKKIKKMVVTTSKNSSTNKASSSETTETTLGKVQKKKEMKKTVQPDGNTQLQSSMLAMFHDADENPNLMTNTLTETWNMCQKAMTTESSSLFSDESSSMTVQQSDTEMPAADEGFINLLRLIVDPKVQRCAGRMLSYFEANSQTFHTLTGSIGSSAMEQSTFTEQMFQSNTQGPSPHYQQGQNHHYRPQLGSSHHYVPQPGPSHQYQPRPSHQYQPGPSHQYQQGPSHQYQQGPSHQYQPGPSENHELDITTQANMTSPFSSPCSTEQSEDQIASASREVQMPPNKHLSVTRNAESIESTPEPPLRRSPRKSLAQHFEKSVESVTNPGKQLLLKQYPDVWVDSERVSKAVTAANKSDKPGYRLCYLLLLAAFTSQELAASRGQGLTKCKDGDCRPTLDKTKMEAIKDYTRRWCRKNEKRIPDEAELNNSVTEQINYCRKQRKTRK